MGLPGIAQFFKAARNARRMLEWHRGLPRGTVVRIRFGPFTLDLDTRQLTQDNREIHLTPKAFELLTMLVQDRPKVLSKAALQNRLWPDTFVAEANLSNLVAEIRGGARDRARAPTFIRTAHGFGYAFCGEATTLPETATGPPIDRRAGSSGIGCAFHSRWASTSSDAIPTSRSGSTTRRSPAATRGSSSPPKARCSRISAARTARFAAANASPRRCGSPTAMRSASDRCS